MSDSYLDAALVELRREQGRQANRKLADLVASGHVTDHDAEAVHTFTTFMDETPLGVGAALRSGDRGAVVRCFPDRDAFIAWRTRWLLYAGGMADGPTEPDEYVETIAAMKDGAE